MPNAMTARDITIWILFILLLLTLVVPIVGFSIDFPTPEYYDTYPPGEYFLMGLALLPVVWFITSWPLLISYIIAKCVKYEISHGILLVVAIGYASFFAIIAITSDSTYFCGMRLFVLTLLSTPIMIPVWTTVLIMNAFYIKQATANLETSSHFGENNDQ